MGFCFAYSFTLTLFEEIKCYRFKGSFPFPLSLAGVSCLMSIHVCILPHVYISWFLNLDTMDILVPAILCCKVCPVHHRMLSSIPDLHSLDASSTTILSPTFQPPTHKITKNASMHCQYPLEWGGGANHHWYISII